MVFHGLRRQPLVNEFRIEFLHVRRFQFGQLYLGQSTSLNPPHDGPEPPGRSGTHRYGHSVLQPLHPQKRMLRPGRDRGQAPGPHRYLCHLHQCLRPLGVESPAPPRSHHNPTFRPQPRVHFPQRSTLAGLACYHWPCRIPVIGYSRLQLTNLKPSGFRTQH